MEEIIKKVQRIKQWVIDNETLPDFKKNNNEFMKFAVEISNNIRYLITTGQFPAASCVMR